MAARERGLLLQAGITKTQKLSAAVAEATREGNQWLVERLGLPDPITL